MVQAIIKLGEHQDRVLTILKGKFGLKNKSEVVNFIIEQYEEEHLEPELRPEYLEKIVKIEQVQIEQRKEQTEQRNIIIEMKTDIKWIRKSVEKLLGQNNE